MKIINEFISELDRWTLVSWIDNMTAKSKSHVKDPSKSISDKLNGFSILYKFTDTELTNKIVKYQGDYTDETPPVVLTSLKNKIVNELKIKDDHCFVQILVLNKGGEVPPHYDSATDGYVNYKCNIVLCGEQDDLLYVGKDCYKINKRDLFCFEASLYKHSMGKGEERRVVLSFGFILPYEDLGWDDQSPRVKLSKRIMSLVDQH